MSDGDDAAADEANDAARATDEPDAAIGGAPVEVLDRAEAPLALDRDDLIECAHGVARWIVRGAIAGALVGVGAFAAEMALGVFGHGGWALLAWLLLPVFGALATGIGVYVGGVVGGRRAARRLLIDSGLLAAMVARVLAAVDRAAAIAEMMRGDGDLRSKSPVAQQVKSLAYPMIVDLVEGAPSRDAVPAYVAGRADRAIRRWGRVGTSLAVAGLALVLALPAILAALF